MGKKDVNCVLDEPTTGLHFADIAWLPGLESRHVDSGRSVIIIEHHRAVVALADWIIDLGRTVFAGTPAHLVARPTPTGAHGARRQTRSDAGYAGETWAWMGQRPGRNAKNVATPDPERCHSLRGRSGVPGRQYAPHPARGRHAPAALQSSIR